MSSSLWECIYSKGFHLLTDLWTAVNLGIRLWFLRVMERSGIEHRVRPSRQCGTKKSTEVSKGQLEDQGWVEWKERDHASARCQASRVGFKLGKAATAFLPSYPKHLRGGNTASSTLHSMQKLVTCFPRESTPSTSIWIPSSLFLRPLKQWKDLKNCLS